MYFPIEIVPFLGDMFFFWDIYITTVDGTSKNPLGQLEVMMERTSGGNHEVSQLLLLIDGNQKSGEKSSWGLVVYPIIYRGFF